MTSCRGASRHRIEDTTVHFEQHVSLATKNTFETCFYIEDDGEKFVFGEICLCDGPGFEKGDVGFTPANVGSMQIGTISQILERMKELQKVKENKHGRAS
jgi:hypothetical protein